MINASAQKKTPNGHHAAYFFHEDARHSVAVALTCQGELTTLDASALKAVDKNNTKIYKNSYLFDTLLELHHKPSAEELYTELNVPTCKDMAQFMIQRYLIPNMRELEIIECGVQRAIKRLCPRNKPIKQALHSLFQNKQKTLEETKRNLFQATQKTLKKKHPQNPMHQFYASFSAAS